MSFCSCCDTLYLFVCARVVIGFLFVQLIVVIGHDSCLMAFMLAALLGAIMSVISAAVVGSDGGGNGHGHGHRAEVDGLPAVINDTPVQEAAEGLAAAGRFGALEVLLRRHAAELGAKRLAVLEEVAETTPPREYVAVLDVLLQEALDEAPEDDGGGDVATTLPCSITCKNQMSCSGEALNSIL